MATNSWNGRLVMNWQEVEIDKGEFFEWLKAKQDNEVIGIKASCGKCPIAQYLNENYPLPNNGWWMVNTKHYYPFRSEVHLFNKLPNWAQTFVEEIDNYFSEDYKEATKEMCIQVMIEFCL